MKKYLSAVLAVTFIVGLCGCGDNKTKEKLYGTSVISAANPGGGNGGSSSSSASRSAEVAASAVQAAQMGVAASSYASGPTAPRRSSRRVPSGPTYNSATGFFTASYEGSEVQFRFLDSFGNPLAPSDGTNIWTIDFEAIKKVNVKMTAGSSSVNLTMDVSDIGQPMSGQVIVTSDGMSYTCTLTNIVSDEYGTITSGQVRVVSGSWTVALTFRNGTASGTITGPNYSANVSINSDGTGTYTDSDGTQQIS